MAFIDPHMKSERKPHSLAAKERSYSIGSNIIHLMTPLGSNDHVYSNDPPDENLRNQSDRLSADIFGSSSVDNHFSRGDSSPDAAERSAEDDNDPEIFIKARFLNLRKPFNSPYLKISDPQLDFVPDLSDNSAKDTEESEPEMTENEVNELLTRVKSHFMFPREKSLAENHPWHSWTSAPACFPVKDASTNTEDISDSIPIVYPEREEFYMLGGDGKPVKKTVSPLQGSSGKTSTSPPDTTYPSDITSSLGCSIPVEDMPPPQAGSSAIVTKECSYKQSPRVSSHKSLTSVISIPVRIPRDYLSSKYRKRKK